VGSLCNLVLNKNSQVNYSPKLCGAVENGTNFIDFSFYAFFQGLFSHFRLNQVDENPLTRKRKRDSGIYINSLYFPVEINNKHELMILCLGFKVKILNTTLGYLMKNG
jgi:hypothetical protein